ncbi:MAG: hypothetical protein U5J98_01230 [Halobacteriales archaeon]|nr:hypothetical protein [Halobacteriales archaeon]
MVSLGGAVVVGILVAVHTVAAAVATRLLRVRLETAWGPVVFALVLVPLALVASTIVVTGALGLGADLGGPDVAWFLLVVVPLGLGLAIDYLWMPPPDAVGPPAADDGG